MNRFSIFFFFFFCSLAILAESTPAGLSTTTETSRSNECDVRNVIEKPHADIMKSKSVKNDPEYSLMNQTQVKDVVQIGEQASTDLYLNKTSSDAPTISTVLDNHTKDIQYAKREASSSNHKNRSEIDLSSHDILVDPSDVISIRLTRQEKSVADYFNPSSVENTSAKPDIESESISSSQGSLNLKGDLGVAENRYRFQYPYWYRGQFANQRYRANDRREFYRNYLRYPVFPGK